MSADHLSGRLAWLAESVKSLGLMAPVRVTFRDRVRLYLMLRRS